jgi:sugar O-acyltransferase (sialic acid O-acetyltransferase NeuD family)
MMKPKKVVLWGASNTARVVAGIIRLQGEYELVGFLDDTNLERRGEPFCGAVVLGGREQLELLKARDVSHIIMAFGNNRARLKLAAIARAKGYQLASVLHPSAVIAADVRIGAGTAVMAGVTIDAGTVIGENALINPGAILNHGCKIHDGAHVNAGSLLGGNVIIGKAATIEIGAIVGGSLTIGAGSVVGAGAVVLKDVPEGVLAYGNPAKVIRRIDLRD